MVVGVTPNDQGLFGHWDANDRRLFPPFVSTRFASRIAHVGVTRGSIRAVVCEVGGRFRLVYTIEPRFGSWVFEAPVDIGGGKTTS